MPVVAVVLAAAAAAALPQLPNSSVAALLADDMRGLLNARDRDAAPHADEGGDQPFAGHRPTATAPALAPAPAPPLGPAT